MFSQCCKTYSKYKPVTHVIFDLDGTLIDSEGVYSIAIQQTIESFGKTCPTDLFAKIAGSVQEDSAKKCIELLNLDTTMEDFLKFFNEEANKKIIDLDLRPGAEKFVRHLHNNNIPIAIATSSRSDSYELKTKKYEELFSLFHHIVCGGTDPEVEKGKPAPDIFLICASRFDESPEPSKCLVLEDSINGVMAALAAGMQVVMTPEESVPYSAWKMATLRIDTFEYMMPQLFGLPPFPSAEEPPVFPQDLEENVIPLKENVIPLEEKAIPLEENVIPLEENAIPLEENVIPLEENTSLEENVIPLEENAIPEEES